MEKRCNRELSIKRLRAIAGSQLFFSRSARLERRLAFHRKLEISRSSILEKRIILRPDRASIRLFVAGGFSYAKAASRRLRIGILGKPYSVLLAENNFIVPSLWDCYSQAQSYYGSSCPHAPRNKEKRRENWAIVGAWQVSAILTRTLCRAQAHLRVLLGAGLSSAGDLLQ